MHQDSERERVRDREKEYTVYKVEKREDVYKRIEERRRRKEKGKRYQQKILLIKEARYH